MTAATDTGPDAAQVEKATALAARLLSAHNGKHSRDPRIAAAFGRALAVTSPRSEHGQLLAAALRPGTLSGRPAEDLAVWWLARRGDTPTAGAVETRLRQAQARRAKADRLAAAAAAHVEGDGVRAATFIAETLRDTGHGPTWRELATAMGWPHKPWGVQEAIIRGLARAGWLEFTREPRSLRPGAAARKLATGRAR